MTSTSYAPPSVRRAAKKTIAMNAVPTQAGQSAAQKPEIAETLRRVSVVLAQQEGMAGPQKFLPHGSRLFRVQSGWQGKALAGDAGVAVCATLRELDAAVRDENKPVIFLPADAMMTEADIERVCQRHGVVKTLFWEERDA